MSSPKEKKIEKRVAIWPDGSCVAEEAILPVSVVGFPSACATKAKRREHPSPPSSSWFLALAIRRRTAELRWGWVDASCHCAKSAAVTRVREGGIGARVSRGAVQGAAPKYPWPRLGVV
jgi:hypothetical protein